MKHIFLLLLVVSIICQAKPSQLTFATGPHGTSYYETGQHIAAILEKDRHFSIEIISDSVQIENCKHIPNSIVNCQLLYHTKVDLAISQNDVAFPHPSNNMQTDTNIRSIMPLYSTVFFLIYHEKLAPSSLQDLIVGNNVAMGPRSSGTARFTQTLLKEFGIDTTQYTPVYCEFEDNILCDSVDICCSLTGFSNPRIARMLTTNGKLFSLGDYQLIGKGSTIDGFCLKVPTAKPYIIPKNLYRRAPQKPILTAAVDAVLLTHDNVSAENVYDIIQSLTENKQFFAIQKQDKLLSEINERFSPSHMLFPMHRGALNYIYRDKPTFLERYAETIALLLSILIAFVGGAQWLSKWKRQQKKDRIDTFYSDVLKIQKKVKHFARKTECKQALKTLLTLREKAFDQLIEEELVADESFHIFISLWKDTKQEIESKMAMLDGK